MCSHVGNLFDVTLLFLSYENTKHTYIMCQISRLNYKSVRNITLCKLIYKLNPYHYLPQL